MLFLDCADRLDGFTTGTIGIGLGVHNLQHDSKRIQGENIFQMGGILFWGHLPKKFEFSCTYYH